LDVVAATLDEQLRPPRHGDSDDGRGFLLGPPEANRWATLLAVGSALYGAPDWWPPCPPDAASSLISALGDRKVVTNRPTARPSSYPDAGLTILRTTSAGRHEIWCRCDGGPHGFLSIAAHAHADALSVEVRHGGVDILADPATYCYHGEDRWRTYFRSTLAHNTIEMGGVDQSSSGGHFLWTRQAETRVLDADNALSGDVVSWCAEHDGYTVLDPPVRHRRTVRLFRAARRLEIRDTVDTPDTAGTLARTGAHPYRIAYHLGPTVTAELDGSCVRLSWPTPGGSHTGGQLQLPEQSAWSLVRGRTDPVLGWYSAGFGEKEPSTTLLGEGRCQGSDEFVTVLRFDD
jgi:Heparinase II/III-like protein